MMRMALRGVVMSWLVVLCLGLGLGAAITGALDGAAAVGEAAGREAAAGGASDASPREPQAGPTTAGAPDFRQVVKRVMPSVVTVRSQRMVEVQRRPFGLFGPFEEFFGGPPGPGGREGRDGTDRFVQQGLGSGVIVDSRGYVLTNNHVVQDTSRLEIVLPDGKVVPAKVTGTDPQTDLAVLRIEAAGLRAITLGRSSDLEVGEWVLAVGNPFAEALAHTVTAGIVSATGRSNLNLADYEDFIQTDAAINPGNSGGALVNTRGELVGINTAIATGTGGSMGIGFAIPIDMAREIMDKLIRDGRVVRGYIGVTIQDLTPEMAKAGGIEATSGAIIAGVQQGGPAAQAGLKQGDVITGIDGHAVTDKDEVRTRIAATAPGTRVRLSVERDGRRMEIPVTLKELSATTARGAPGGEENGTEEGLGLTVRNLTPEIAGQLGYDGERGALVSRVEPGSAADAAGLSRGDLIQEVNRRPVANVSEFRRELSRTAESDVVLMLVRRGEDSFFVTVRNR